MTDFKRLAEEIIAGKRIRDKAECTDMIHCNLADLTRGADRIRENFCGNKIDLCSIINGRSGRCSEDCKFCAQSKINHTGIEEYSFLPAEDIVADCGNYAAKGVDRYSIVTAGRTLIGRDLDRAAEAYGKLHQKYPEMKLCGSHGLLTESAFQRLKDAGVETIHCNIESSPSYFPKICSTHTFEEKRRAIDAAKRVGLKICSGGIIGMGETWDDRIEMALTTAELGACSIPINTLIPIPGTPFGELEQLSREDILRTVSIFRYINPEAHIRIAAGRFLFPDGGRQLFKAGASATITGDMLTTTGNNTEEDRKMLTDMGFELAAPL